MEYVSAWIAEARTMADTIDAQFFTNGLPEERKEAEERYGRLARCYHTFEMSLSYIQAAIDQTGAYIYDMEQEARKQREAEEMAIQAAEAGKNIVMIQGKKHGGKE